MAQMELKTREETLRSAEAKAESLNMLIRERDKKNVELYNTNKGLTEKLKATEGQLREREKEYEAKRKLLAQKTAEAKALASSNSALQAANEELSSKLSELTLTQLTCGNKETATSPRERENERNDEPFEEILSVEPVRHESNEESDIIRGKDELRRRVEVFVAREREFNRLQVMFLERLYQTSEQLKTQEREVARLTEENISLRTTNDLLLNSNKTLHEKVSTLETALRGVGKHEEHAAVRREEENTRFTHTTAVSKDHTASSFHKHRFEVSPQSTSVVNKVLDVDDFANLLAEKDVEVKNTADRSSLMEVLSPEMMSNEETLTFMTEVLRRASYSLELLRMMNENEEHKRLQLTVARELYNFRESEFRDRLHQTTRQKSRKRENNRVVRYSTL
eukprot:TRINITY_DN4584_c0_g4_i1.p1 TRINITY_DN4584_c0_g4~~TRINITY_DN4584_c0_g4_i1.p1  ORF type:complete len:395 (+),score=65.43 TRINITY_DN4584_c0_g4_i1:338-1522(+)